MLDQIEVPAGFGAGLLTGAVVMAVIALLWRRARPGLARLRYLLAAGLVIVLAITAGALYLASSGDFGFGAGGEDSVPVSAPAPTAAAGPTPVARTTGSASSPADAGAWLALAEERGAQRDYAGARAAYARVVELQGMSAQSWAEYGEVLSALAGGSLGGEAGAAVDTALSLDAWNPTAMRLKASQEHQLHHDAEAIVWWRRLRAVLPPDSPEVPGINTKIAEAEALKNATPPPPPPQNRR
jgi:cytochrome c-type biogenesis protein CcmH/NrfG